MSDYNKVGFEKAFKKAIPNFNELIAHFKHKRKMYEPSKVVFIWKNTLWKFEMFKSQYEIDNWKNHFIEFFKTGEFDYNGYWKKYTTDGRGNNKKFIDDKIYKIPLCKNYGNDFYEHSNSLQEFYSTPEANGIGKQYGFEIVPKPLEDSKEIIIEIKTK